MPEGNVEEDCRSATHGALAGWAEGGVDFGRAEGGCIR